MLDWNKEYSSEEWKSLSPEERKEIAKQRKAKGYRKPKKNDWRFYALTEQIAKDFGSIPYNRLPGLQLNLPAQKKSGTAYSALSNNPRRIYGVCRLRYVTTRGVARQKTDGINMAASQLYTFVRRANSGARNYEAPDLMMYILAMDEIYAEYAELVRAVKTVGLYDIENHYLPDLLLTAMFINPTDARQNIAQYRGQLNVLASKINAMAVPKYFNIFKRRDFVASNVFMDSSSKRGQFYVYVREGYYTFTGVGSEKGTSLEYTAGSPSGSGTQTLQQRMNRLVSMIDALFYDDDAITMSGDILKAFGDSGLYHVEETPENAVLTLAFDEDALAQIENSYAIGDLLVNGGAQVEPGLNITQSDAVIKFAPIAVIQDTYALNLKAKILNSHKDNPDFKDNLEWTRLMSTYDIVTSGTDRYLHLTSVGCELILAYDLLKYVDSVGSTSPIIDLRTIMSTDVNGATSAGQQYAFTAMLFEQFDWHPILYPDSSTTASTGAFIIVGDLKKYTVIDDSTIQALNEAANVAVVFADSLYKAAGVPSK